MYSINLLDCMPYDVFVAASVKLVCHEYWICTFVCVLGLLF